MNSNFFRHSSSSADGLLAAVGGSFVAGSMARGGRFGTDGDPSRTTPRSNMHVAVRDLHTPLQFIADTLSIIVLSLATGTLYNLLSRGVPGPIIDFTCTGLVTALLFAAIDRLLTGRRLAARTTSFDRIRDAAQAWTLSFAALVFIFFALKTGSEMSRGAVLSLYFLGLPPLAVWRVFTPIALAPLVRKAGTASRECIIIGDNADPLIEKFAAALEANGHPAPMVLTCRAACIPALWPRELKGLATRVMDAARELGPGEIYVCAGAIPSDRLGAIARALSILPRAIFVVPDAQTSSLVRCKPASIGTHIALEVRREPLGRTQRAIKRLLDVTIAAVSLSLLFPFLALVALLIKLHSSGPVFFRQTRNGYRGKPFKIWKFRSMHVQADGHVFQQARRDDARVTSIGRFLRKSSIDELPQILNVLCGEMSLVGPRPHPLALDEIYAHSIENYEVRQHVKPGLTGWAQVNGLRGETATLDLMYRRIEFDLWYAVNASILLDIEILVRTIIEVCRHRNAY